VDNLNWVHNVLCICLLQPLLSDCAPRTVTASTSVPQPPSLSSAHTTNSSHVPSAIRTSSQTNAISFSFKYFELPNSHHQSVICVQVYRETGICFARKDCFKYTSRYIKASIIFLAGVTLFEWHIHENYMHCCSVWLYQTEIRANLFDEIGTEFVNSCVLRVRVECLFCVRVCVCLCVCVYIYIYSTNMYTYIHTHTYVYGYLNIFFFEQLNSGQSMCNMW